MPRRSPTSGLCCLRPVPCPVLSPPLPQGSPPRLLCWWPILVCDFSTWQCKALGLLRLLGLNFTWIIAAPLTWPPVSCPLVHHSSVVLATAVGTWGCLPSGFISWWTCSPASNKSLPPVRVPRSHYSVPWHL